MVSKFIFIFIIINATANAGAWPKPDVGNCEFYQKLENELHCKAVGVDYLSHYAPFYCEAFMKKSKTWGPPLNRWSQKTGACLQEMLYEQRSNSQFNCQTMEGIAFKTHTACYDEAQLCELKVSELIEVLKVIRIKDFLREFKYSHREIYKLAKSCVNSWISN